MRHYLLIIACAALAACQPKAAQEPSKFDVATPMEEMMEHVIDPAAKAYWGTSGVVIDADGEHSLVPTTDEGFMIAENAAMTVVEASNILLLPERRRDDGDWVTYAQGLGGAAREAFKAAEKRDGDAMFETGAALYQVCTSCHEKYLLPYLGPDGYPTKLGPDGKPNPLLKDNPPAK